MAATEQACSARRFKMAVIFAGLLCVFMAVADSDVELQTYYYDLGPALRITKPILSWANQWSLNTLFNARFSVDRVQTREIDSMSGASQYGNSSANKVEERQEYLLGVAHTLDQWKLEAGYVLSLEDDYRSSTPSLLLARDFNQRSTTLSLGYARSSDEVKGSYMDSWQSKSVDNISLALTQVLTPVSLMQLGYTLQENNGYLGTGNRQVLLNNGLYYDEYLPEERRRQALGLRYAHWLPSRTALHLGYRVYHDDWRLNSRTWQLQLHQHLSDDLTLRAESRFYHQDAAYFVRDQYDGSEFYLTSASTLRDFDSRLLGLKLSYTPRWWSDQWQLQTKFERYTQSSGLRGDLFMLSVQSSF